jgi:branched-chain amino acid transport system substrate-binding protein
MTRNAFLMWVVGGISLFAVGCQKTEDTEIRIAVCAPLTGPQSKIGSDMARGVEVAVEQWNARGGVLGKKIVLLKGDDEATPKQATAVARQVVNQGAVGVIGHFNSGCTIPASSIYNDSKVICITPAATNPTVTDRGLPGMFRVCGRDDQQGSTGAKYAIEKLAAKRVAILHDKTTYGQGLADEFKKTLEAGGLPPVYYGGVPKEETDFRAVVTAIKNTNPDLWYFGGIYDQGGPLINQARQVGLTAPLMSGDGLIDKEFIKTAGKNCEGTYLTFGPDPIREPSAKAFLDAYHAKFGDHGAYSIYGYDAANILLTAIQDAKTTDFKPVADYIHQHPFETAMGKLKFDAKGDLQGSYYVIWTVKDGQFIVHDDSMRR